MIHFKEFFYNFNLILIFLYKPHQYFFLLPIKVCFLCISSLKSVVVYILQKFLKYLPYRILLYPCLISWFLHCKCIFALFKKILNPLAISFLLLISKGFCSKKWISWCQDANPVLLEVLLRQKCQKIYVGDEHKQIYLRRGSINSYTGHFVVVMK